MPAATIRLNPLDGLSILQYGTSRVDGWIVVPSVSPGVYGVTVGDLPAGIYVRSVRAGGTDITQTGLNLLTGISTDLEIVLAEDGGKVVGQLFDAARQPIVGGRVSLMRASPHRAERELWGRTASANQQGQFDHDDLAPGEYTVSAYANGRSSPSQTIRVLAKGVTRLQLVIP
jgi:Carboxypeptidase regulatory-like domain